MKYFRPFDYVKVPKGNGMKHLVLQNGRLLCINLAEDA